MQIKNYKSKSSGLVYIIRVIFFLSIKTDYHFRIAWENEAYPVSFGPRQEKTCFRGFLPSKPQKAKEYDQETPQSYTTDQHIAP